MHNMELCSKRIYWPARSPPQLNTKLAYFVQHSLLYLYCKMVKLFDETRCYVVPIHTELLVHTCFNTKLSYFLLHILMGQPRPLVCLFSSFSTTILTVRFVDLQQDSNSKHWEASTLTTWPPSQPFSFFLSKMMKLFGVSRSM